MITMKEALLITSTLGTKRPTVISPTKAYENRSSRANPASSPTGCGWSADEQAVRDMM